MCKFAAKLSIFWTFLLLLAPVRAQKNFSGTPEIEQSFQKLNVLGSVLMIGAHPDDENTALLAYFARGRHVRTAYLSVTRGEGGQNLIGPEQGDLLGIIRTQELLAARGIDGAGQFFTRAIDFGFSKSADETMAKWGRNEILSDMVWVIRRYRPDVVITRFSGTPRDGHGHHQASAILAKEAFVAAADPKRFPEQMQFVQAWRAKRLLFNTFSFTRSQETEAARTPGRLELDAGEFNPVLGKSYSEIAGISRSQHRTQGMGAPERHGPSKNYLMLVAGAPATKDVFDGIDTSWNRVRGGAGPGRLLAEAMRNFQVDHPERSIPLLLKARPLIAAIRDPLAAEKLKELDEAIGLCAGLWLDAEADRYQAAPGGSFQVNLTALDRSGFAFDAVSARLEGMGVSRDVVLSRSPLTCNRPVSAGVQMKVPPGEPYSQPFWLRKPKSGGRYTIDDRNLIGVADVPPLMRAVFQLKAGATSIEIARPVSYRYVDRVRGELTRPVIVSPEVALDMSRTALVFPNNKPRRIEVLVRANVASAAGQVRLDLPDGWSAMPSARPFRLSAVGEQQSVAFEVTPPAQEMAATIRAVADLGGRPVASGMETIAYSHIPAQVVFPPAEAKLVRSDIRVTAKNVAYIMGAGDEMPESLRQLGCQVTLLGPEDLQQRNLAGFDAIVTGVRAYNVRADLRAGQRRLLDYVNNGGTLIVEYNVLDGNLPELGPYPFQVSRGRVAMEEAAVRFPNARNPLLHTPNEITQRDFAGWVQERGLYFASDWDSKYEPVLACHDTGEPDLPGGMLYARYGKGVYIFSGYSWFRQLPAGVPGAYRIFANMLSAK
ncbi:MAG: PIG-L family deacetylase [Acidobacteria bacterium]|nr:PIG-L family deacetylase [Acidobacteriota bacterium]